MEIFLVMYFRKLVHFTFGYFTQNHHREQRNQVIFFGSWVHVNLFLPGTLTVLKLVHKYVKLSTLGSSATSNVGQVVRSTDVLTQMFFFFQRSGTRQFTSPPTTYRCYGLSYTSPPRLGQLFNSIFSSFENEGTFITGYCAVWFRDGFLLANVVL